MAEIWPNLLPRKAFRTAVCLHYGLDSGHFLGLMRKRLPPSPERTALAIEFRELGLPSALYRGASNIHEFWRALRCSVILARLAQQNHNP